MEQCVGFGGMTCTVHSTSDQILKTTVQTSGLSPDYFNTEGAQ